MTKMKAGRTRLAAVLACMVCVGCSTGSTPGSTAGPLASQQTFSFPIQHDVTTLDPAMIDTEPESSIGQNLFDGLLKFDINMNLVPDIASAMPKVSPDGLTYTFTLRNDVTFSNGDKVTAQDVVYSWNRAAAMQGAYAPDLSIIAGYSGVAANQISGAALEALLEKKDPSVTLSGLSAPDDQTVVVKLATASGWFTSAIAQPASVASIVDQKVVKNDFDNWWAKPETVVGTGPFKVSAHDPDHSLDLTAQPTWWGRPKPTLTKVHIDVVSDPAGAMTKYDQGSDDLFGYGGYSPAVADVHRYQGKASLKSQVYLEPGSKSYWISFNMVSDAKRPAGGPFTLDQGKAAHDLREAFALSLDRTNLAKQLCDEIACIAATGGVIPRGLAGFLGDGADPLAAFDPAKARNLLLSADPNLTKTKGLVYAYDPENPFNEPTARFLQKAWETNLGVSVTPQPVPRTTFIANRLKGAYVMSRDGWTTAYNHPQDWFDNLWGTVAGCPDTTCSTGYVTRAYDDLLAKADSEPLVSAVADYKAVSRLLIDDVAYIPLYYTLRPMLIKPYVLGAGHNNLCDYYWNQIQIASH